MTKRPNGPILEGSGMALDLADVRESDKMYDVVAAHDAYLMSEAKRRMAKATHTPGPWRVEQASGGWYRTRRTIASSEHSGPGVTDGRDCVAEVCRESEPRAEADARLIAAAPDLLAAARGVEVVYAYMQKALPGLVGTPQFDIVTDAVRSARAAIAKATS